MEKLMREFENKKAEIVFETTNSNFLFTVLSFKSNLKVDLNSSLSSSSLSVNCFSWKLGSATSCFKSILLFNSENLFKIYFFFNDPYGFQHVHGIYPDFKFSKMVRAVF